MTRLPAQPIKRNSGPDPDGETLVFGVLLTTLLGAVSQQFLHMLILNALGRPDLSARIKEVDDADFVSAMRLIEHLVSRGHRVEVAPHRISPGACVASILRTEKQTEDSIRNALASTSEVRSRDERILVERVEAPRAAYQIWLDRQAIPGTNAQSDVDARIVVRLLASDLLHLIEQAMLNAFGHWSEKNDAAANISWRISGAAMMYMTALAGYCGLAEANDGIEVAASAIEGPLKRDRSETDLAQRCLKTARAVALHQLDPHLSRIMHEIADDCERLVRLRRDPGIRLELGHSDIFCAFENARDRMRA